MIDVIERLDPECPKRPDPPDPDLPDPDLPDREPIVYTVNYSTIYLATVKYPDLHCLLRISHIHL
jgi:hypothetical protein